MNRVEYDNLLANARTELDKVEAERNRGEEMRRALLQVSARRASPADYAGSTGAIPKTSGSNPQGDATDRTGQPVSPRIDVEEETTFYRGVEQTLERAGFQHLSTEDPGTYRQRLASGEFDSKQ